ncbi:hypothetical protein ACWEOE_30810 [Amycolatopsis sp. NPDC004368]
MTAIDPAAPGAVVMRGLSGTAVVLPAEYARLPFGPQPRRGRRPGRRGRPAREPGAGALTWRLGGRAR